MNIVIKVVKWSIANNAARNLPALVSHVLSLLTWWPWLGPQKPDCGLKVDRGNICCMVMW